MFERQEEAKVSIKTRKKNGLRKKNRNNKRKMFRPFIRLNQLLNKNLFKEEFTRAKMTLV